jgi:hypothetical protein
MPEITLAQIEEAHRALLATLERLGRESEPKQIQALGNQLARDGAALEALAQEFERQERARAGPRVQARIEVALTDEQQRRIRERTGIDMPSLFIDDAAGAVNRAMPHMSPGRIELLALREAEAQKAALKTQAQLGTTVDELLERLRTQGGRAAQEMIERLQSDPNWIGHAGKKR